MKKSRICLIACILCHFSLTFLTGMFRNWGFLTSIHDLAHSDQAVWGTIHGSLLLNTDTFNMATSRLAVHFDPILLIFILPYLLIPSVAWLMAGQSLALSITAWPIYNLARRVHNSDKIGLVWALIYLVNPFIVNAAIWDFHPITLAVPFVAMCFVALESKNFKLMLFCAVILLLCKEHLGIMIVGFGILWLIRTRKWIPGTIIILLGTFHFYVVFKIIMPAFSSFSQHVMISQESGLGRYAWLGQSLSDIVKNISFHPIYVLKTVMIDMNGGYYLFLLVLPFLGLSLLGLPFLLPAVADLTANLLPVISLPKSPISYHSATLIPILLIAAIYGSKNLLKIQKRYPISAISMFVLFSSTMLGYFLAPLPLPGAINFWKPNHFISLPDPRLSELHRLVGQSSSLSVQANIGPHFSQRKELYTYPNNLNKVDAIVLWLDSPTRNIPGYVSNKDNKHPPYIGTLDGHLQMDRNDYLESVEKLLQNENFRIAYWDDPWLVFKRGVNENQKHDVSAVKAKLQVLKEKWN